MSDPVINRIIYDSILHYSDSTIAILPAFCPVNEIIYMYDFKNYTTATFDITGAGAYNYFQLYKLADADNYSVDGYSIFLDSSQDLSAGGYRIDVSSTDEGLLSSTTVATSSTHGPIFQVDFGETIEVSDTNKLTFTFIDLGSHEAKIKQLFVGPFFDVTILDPSKNQQHATWVGDSPISVQRPVQFSNAFSVNGNILGRSTKSSLIEGTIEQEYVTPDFVYNWWADFTEYAVSYPFFYFPNYLYTNDYQVSSNAVWAIADNIDPPKQTGPGDFHSVSMKYMGIKE